MKQDARPAIITANLDDSTVMRESIRDDHSRHSQSKRGTVPLRETKDLDQENMILTEDLANIIRRCWQTDINSRPSLAQVAQELNDQIKFLFEENDSQHHESAMDDSDDVLMRSARD